jgi:hypothetical protein
MLYKGNFVDIVGTHHQKTTDGDIADREDFMYAVPILIIGVHNGC